MTSSRDDLDLSLSRQDNAAKKWIAVLPVNGHGDIYNTPGGGIDCSRTSSTGRNNTSVKWESTRTTYSHKLIIIVDHKYSSFVKLFFF